MDTQEKEALIERLATYTMLQSGRDWPGSTADYSAVASPRHRQLFDHLNQLVEQATGNPIIPVVVLKPYAPAQELMAYIAAKPRISTTDYQAAFGLQRGSATAMMQSHRGHKAIYVSQHLLDTLSPEELTAVLAHEAGHAAAPATRHHVEAVYGEDLSHEELIEKRSLISECMADQFVPAELKPYLASALHKILTGQPSPLQPHWHQILERQGTPPTHPSVDQRERAAREQASIQLGDAARLLYTTDCQITQPQIHTATSTQALQVGP